MYRYKQTNKIFFNFFACPQKYFFYQLTDGFQVKLQAFIPKSIKKYLNCIILVD